MNYNNSVPMRIASKLLNLPAGIIKTLARQGYFDITREDGELRVSRASIHGYLRLVTFHGREKAKLDLGVDR